MIDWNVLGIEPTTELIAIKKAYAKKVKEYHPEDDPKGFQTLRENYELALKCASNSADRNKIIHFEPADMEQEDNQPIVSVKSTPLNKTVNQHFTKQSLDDFMEEVERLYEDNSRKDSKEEWEKLLESDMLWDLEVMRVVSLRMSAFLKVHNQITYDILLFLNSYFSWADEPEELLEQFFTEEGQKEIKKTKQSSWQFMSKFMEDAAALYNSAERKENQQEWQKLLKNDRLSSPDIKRMLSGRMLKFLRDNHDLSNDILILLNDCFNWTEFPESFLGLFAVEEQPEIIGNVNSIKNQYSSERLASRFMENMIALYNDIYRRDREKEWKRLLEDELLWNIEVKRLAARKALVFFKTYHKISYDILFLLNDYFEWVRQPDRVLDLFLTPKEQKAFGNIKAAPVVWQNVSEFMRELEALHDNISRRNNIKEWQKLLENELLINVEMKCMLYPKVSQFLQDYHEVPYEVLVLLNEYFNWTDEADELLDIFLNEEEIITLSKKSNHSVVRFKAAAILFYRAINVERAGNSGRAIAYYNEAEKTLEGVSDTAAEILIVKIIFGKTEVYEKLQRYEDAIEMYNNFLLSFGQSENTAITVYKAYALLYIGELLYCQNNRKEALKAFRKVIWLFYKCRDKKIKHVVKTAVWRLIKEIKINIPGVFLIILLFAIMNPLLGAVCLPIGIALIIVSKIINNKK